MTTCCGRWQTAHNEEAGHAWVMPCASIHPVHDTEQADNQKYERIHQGHFYIMAI